MDADRTLEQQQDIGWESCPLVVEHHLARGDARVDLRPADQRD